MADINFRGIILLVYLSGKGGSGCIDMLKADCMLETGYLAQGRYRVISLLGQGGMSNVYLVEDLRLDNRWVLKEFILPGSISPAERETLKGHFQEEARMLARLDHPSLPRVIDYFSTGEGHYLVEEYIEGRTLARILEEGPFSPEGTIDIAVHLCRVLDYIHRKRIIYRDLKPENVMIRSDGVIKLIDFGIARIFKTGRERDTIITGTPGFAAPEQFGAAQTDGRSDIYSLGALMHHLLTGRDPGHNPFDFEEPSAMGVDIPRELEETVMKALSMKPQDRWKDAGVLLEKLNAVKEGMQRKAGRSTDGNKKAIKETPRLPDEKNTEDISSKNPSKTPGAMLMLICGLVIFMLVALLIESRFRLWILFVYIVVALTVALGVSPVFRKHEDPGEKSP